MQNRAKKQTQAQEKKSRKGLFFSLPQPLLPLVIVCRFPFLVLHIRHKLLVLALVLRIPILLLAQLLARNEIRVFAQLAHRPLALALVLRAQTVGFRALAVGIVVFVGIEGLFELGDGGFDGEGAVVVEEEGATGEAGLVEVGGELVEGGLEGVLDGGDKF